MSLYLLTSSVAQAIGSMIIWFYKADKITYFIILGIIPIIFGIMLFAFKSKINKLIDD